jgi:hypothetical protein
MVKMRKRIVLWRNEDQKSAEWQKATGVNPHTASGRDESRIGEEDGRVYSARGVWGLAECRQTLLFSAQQSRQHSQEASRLWASIWRTGRSTLSTCAQRTPVVSYALLVTGAGTEYCTVDRPSQPRWRGRSLQVIARGRSMQGGGLRLLTVRMLLATHQHLPRSPLLEVISGSTSRLS